MPVRGGGLTKFCVALSPLAIVGGCAALPANPPAVSDNIALARSLMVDVGMGDEPVSQAERSAILSLVGNARVVGFGEFMHGAREPLASRNRWLRILIEHAGFTAVALESGFAESRVINDYILGGSGDPEQVSRDGLGWGFGAYRHNVELIRWLRQWNDLHSDRKIRFYGADLSGGDAQSEMKNAYRAIAELERFFAQTVPDQSATLRRRLRSFEKRFDAGQYQLNSEADRASLTNSLVEARGLFDRYRPQMIAASSEETNARAALIIDEIGRLQAVLAAWPVDDPTDLNALLKVVAIRDRAMADYVLWALDREGPAGRIFSFAANGHVNRAGVSIDLPIGRFESSNVMGRHLAEVLGNDYRVVLTASNARIPGTNIAGQIDRLLERVGDGPFLLDLEQAGQWWKKPRSFTHGLRTLATLVPADGADAFLFVGDMTKEPLTNTPQTNPESPH